MRKVILESPYAGKDAYALSEHIKYARRAVRDSLDRREAPIASHLLYTQEGVLDDSNIIDRRKGIEAGYEWIPVADRMVVYIDYGISPGMARAIDYVNELGIAEFVEYRRIGKNPVELTAGVKYEH